MQPPSPWGRHKLSHIIGYDFLTPGYRFLCCTLCQAKHIRVSVSPNLPVRRCWHGSRYPSASISGRRRGEGLGRRRGKLALCAKLRHRMGYQNSRRCPQRTQQIVTDAMARSHLQNGDACASATRELVLSFADPAQSQVIDAVIRALSNVFQVSITFPAVRLVLSFVEREVKPRKTPGTEFGLDKMSKWNSVVNRAIRYILAPCFLASLGAQLWH